MSMLVAALATALVHFLWQGAALGGVVWLLRPALRRLPSWVRHALLLGALGSAPTLVVLTVLHELGSPMPTVVTASAAIDWSLPIVGAWAIGTSAMSVRLTLAWVGLRRLRATGLPLPRLAGLVTRLAQRLGSRRPVSVAESPAVDVPVVIGILRPMVLLPLGLVTRMKPEHLETVLAHELAHVLRHDVLVNLLQSLVEALLFYHPVVWWLSSQIREAREACCDDLVVDTLGAPLHYAMALTELEEARSQTPTLSLAATEGPLMKRIRHIVTRSPRPSLSRRYGGLLGAALSGTVVLTVACLVHESPPPAPEEDPAELEAAQDQLDPDSPVATPTESSDETSSVGIAWLPEPVADFEEAIVDAAERHGVDPALVAIVVLVESQGRPTVRSPIGARGLMQVMPATAAQIAAERGIADHDASRLDDPEYNLDFGTWYLARQLESFGRGREPDEAVSLAVAAYNGGPEHLQAVLDGDTELREETRFYQDIVTKLWNERDQPSSDTLSRR